jgi:hypothetical protein
MTGMAGTQQLNSPLALAPCPQRCPILLYFLSIQHPLRRTSSHSRLFPWRPLCISHRHCAVSQTICKTLGNQQAGNFSVGIIGGMVKVRLTCLRASENLFLLLSSCISALSNPRRRLGLRAIVHGVILISQLFCSFHHR